MWAVCHSLIGINDDKVNKCQQVKNIIKFLQMNYKDLPKKLPLVRLCGIKHAADDVSAIQCIYGTLIANKWLELKEKKK